MGHALLENCVQRRPGGGLILHVTPSSRLGRNVVFLMASCPIQRTCFGGKMSFLPHLPKYRLPNLQFYTRQAIRMYFGMLDVICPLHVEPSGGCSRLRSRSRGQVDFKPHVCVCVSK